jgi:replicative superfamily II helicase
MLCCAGSAAGPIRALVQERQTDWQARFGQVLGLKVVQLTGDDDSEGLEDLEAADIICSTPEKFGRPNSILT